MRRQSVGPVLTCDFKLRPFSPQVQSGGRLDCFGDVCAAYSRRRLEKIKAPVAAAFDEFGVSHAANQTESADDVAVKRIQLPCVFRVARDLSRSKNPTERNINRRAPILVRQREHDNSFRYYRVDVIDVAW